MEQNYVTVTVFLIFKIGVSYPFVCCFAVLPSWRVHCSSIVEMRRCPVGYRRVGDSRHRASDGRSRRPSRQLLRRRSPARHFTHVRNFAAINRFAAAHTFYHASGWGVEYCDGHICVASDVIAPLLRRIGSVVSKATASADTRRVHRARGAGVVSAPLPCCFFTLSNFVQVLKVLTGFENATQLLTR